MGANSEISAMDAPDKLIGFSQRKANRLANFYRGKTILITGATGFIGKCCLLKLMTCLGDCERIYVVLRPKKELSAQQRFVKMLNDAPFNAKLMDGSNMPDEVKEIQKEQVKRISQCNWSKVVAIEGDMSLEDLGLEAKIKLELCQKVDILFNIAASVQFDAPLKQNLRDNYLGASNILRLALKFQRLISLVHVSTFYSNHHLSHIEEKVLPLSRDCEKLAELINSTPDPLIDLLSPYIMEQRPNTYILTKAMAENLVIKYQGRLPIAIVRPSIVVPSLKDPEPGWVDNLNGPMGLGALGSLGILRNIDWNYWGVCDYIPVDFVVNSMLAIAERTTRLPRDSEIQVYNCSSSSLNPTTWGQCFDYLREEGFKAPPYKMLRIPIEVPKHKRANKLTFALTKLGEILFAYLIDFILVLCGQKRLLTRLTAKLHHGYDILLPFTTNEYTCDNANLVAALEELQPDDKVEFNFDITKLDWKSGFRNAYYGARKRILKEELSNVPAALFKMKILMIVESFFKIMFLALLAYWSLKLYNNYSSFAANTYQKLQVMKL